MKKYHIISEMTRQYHLVKDGRQLGAYSLPQVQSMLQAGQLSVHDSCWTDGMQGWRPIGEVFATASTPVGYPAGVGGTKELVNWVPALVFASVYLGADILLSLIDAEVGGGPVLLFLVLIPLVLFYIFFMMLHHRLWSVLPPQYRTTTPGKAVGFLWIPCFNFYWGFVSWPQLATGYLNWQKECRRSNPVDVYGLTIAYAVLFILQILLFWVPILGFLVSIASFVLFILIYRPLTNVANELR